MKTEKADTLKGAVISGLIAVAIGEGITWMIAFIMKTPTDTMLWAMQAVGWGVFFGSFFSYLRGRREADGFDTAAQ